MLLSQMKGDTERHKYCLGEMKVAFEKNEDGETYTVKNR